MEYGLSPLNPLLYPLPEGEKAFISELKQVPIPLTPIQKALYALLAESLSDLMHTWGIWADRRLNYDDL
jgi:hypothetical protein